MSRNYSTGVKVLRVYVAPRKGRVSRNIVLLLLDEYILVAPRKGRVSRNHFSLDAVVFVRVSRAPQGACE